MKSRAIALVLIETLLVGLAASRVDATALPREVRAYALLAGVEAGPARSVKARIDEIGRLLVRDYAHQPADVVLLHGREATAVALRDALVRLVTEVGSQDRLLVFLSIPTISQHGGVQFVPSGGEPKSPWTLLSGWEIDKIVGTAGLAEVLLVYPHCPSSGLTQPIFATSRNIVEVTFCAPLSIEPKEREAMVRRFLQALREAAAQGHTIGMPVLAERLRAQQRITAVTVAGKGAYTFEPRGERLAPALEALELAEMPDDERVAIEGVVRAVVDEPAATRGAALQRAGPELQRRAVDRSGDAGVRAAAVVALGRLGYRTASGELVALLEESGPPEIRRSAIAALELFGGEAAASIATALRDPDESVRRRAVRSLAERGDANQLDRLLSLAVTDPSTEVRVAALQAAAQLGTELPRVVMIAQSLLRDPSPHVRREAASVVGSLGGSCQAVAEDLREPEVPADVRQAIAYCLGREAREDPSETLVGALVAATTPSTPSEVREAAIWALGKIGGTTSTRHLLEVLEAADGDSTRIHVATVEALGNAGADEAVPRLIDLLGGASDQGERAVAPEVHRAAARSLGEIGDPAAIEPLFRAWASDDPVLARTAEEALRQIQQIQAEPAHLAMGIESPLAHIRQQAVRELIKEASSGRPLSDTQHSLLVSRLGDDDFEVRRSAVEALSLSGPRVVDSLIAALTNESFLIRQGATEVLGRIGAVDAEADLRQRLLDPSGAVRADAYQALVRLDPQVPLKLLLEASQDPDPAVRTVAARGLAQRGEAIAREYLEALAKDRDRQVREEAYEQLRRRFPGSSAP